MKVVNLLVTLCFLFSSSLAFAKPKAYFDAEDSFFNSPELVIDGKRISYGVWGFSNVPEAMESDPLAKALAEDYVSYRNWGHGFGWGGLLAALTYLSVTRSNDSNGNNNFDAGIYWGILVLGFIPSIILGTRSQTKLIRAINQYNGVYDSQETSWQIKPATKGLGLAIHF